MPELLLSCRELTKAFGARPLFAGLSFAIAEGERVGLVGPNGCGKSTLLRVLAGFDAPDDGTRSARKRLRLGYVPQVPEFPSQTTVEGVLVAALAAAKLDPHEVAARVAVTLGKAGFDDPAQPAATLSGGWRKRLAIAQALVHEPDLLLLDEPTNHLDVEGILWLEELLENESAAWLAVSHDRYFLEDVAMRVLELNPVFAGGLFDVPGRYSEYLARKDDYLKSQAAYQESLESQVRRELDWLSRKARARTRKAQARIDEAGRLVQELDDLKARARSSTAGIEWNASERRTRRLVVAEGVRKSYGERLVLDDFELILSPGVRLGLLGANGSGKTTLLRLLAGQDTPEAGRLDMAPNLRVVLFDQHRERLDPALPLRRALAPEGDAVIYQGRSIHVAGWAKRFLFRSEQLDTPLGRLSGGEQARVLIARLMLEPADVLLLDEPTNDLDIPTLEVLEDSLLEFPGALVLVTHDRYLLDRVSTRILALDGRGAVVPYADCAQWEADQARRAREAQGAARAQATSRAVAPNPTQARPKKLSYHEEREWQQMEARVLAAEAQLAAHNAAAHDPAIASDHAALQERLAALHATQLEVDALYARWAELEAKRG
jgi:ATP-binding cassette subfamily F protein uup